MKKIVVALLLILLAMQFYRPSKNIAYGDHAAYFFQETNPPQQVQLLLKTRCFDCHSNNTRYPWYNKVAPISYWFANNISAGKAHLNFSHWESYTFPQKDRMLEAVSKKLQDGKMPEKEFNLIHNQSRLKTDERELIMAWVERSRTLYQLGPRPE